MSEPRRPYDKLIVSSDAEKLDILVPVPSAKGREVEEIRHVQLFRPDSAGEWGAHAVITWVEDDGEARREEWPADGSLVRNVEGFHAKDNASKGLIFRHIVALAMGDTASSDE